MATFAFLVLCVLSCLVQNAYQCSSRPAFRPTMIPSCPIPNYAPAMVPAYAPACSSGIAAPAMLAPSAYGGEGMGDISVAGRMPVAGTTAVAGQVPILGSVRFGGNVPARGTVTITGGSCGCKGRYF